MILRRYTYKSTIFLSAHTDKSICGTDRTLFLDIWTPNIGTQMFGHSLDALLYFGPKCHQFVYVEPVPAYVYVGLLAAIAREQSVLYVYKRQLVLYVYEGRLYVSDRYCMSR